MKNTISKKGNVHLIGVSSKYLEKVAKHAIAGLNDSAQIFKWNKRIDLIIYAAEQHEIHPKMNLFAFTLGRSNRIDFKIDFSRKNIDTIIKVELPMTIYHETAHVVRENTIGYSTTLLDYIIDEGVGCYIEQSVMPEREIPYIHEIKDEKVYWNQAKKSLFKKISWNHSREWFFGTGKLPNWIGYRLGFLIVQEYMNKYPTNLSILARMSSREILKKSDFYNYFRMETTDVR